jgi:hypothetical protein
MAGCMLFLFWKFPFAFGNLTIQILKNGNKQIVWLVADDWSFRQLANQKDAITLKNLGLPVMNGNYIEI